MSLYTETGYTDVGYIDGDSGGIVPLYFRVDVKKTSILSKEEVLQLAKEEIETRQSTYFTKSVYADVYDARDKSITRVFSENAKEAGFGYEDIPFGGDIEHITQELQAIKTPRLKLVNPFDSLMLDTSLVAEDEIYTFSFDTDAIGNGDYRLEISFDGADETGGA